MDQCHPEVHLHTINSWGHRVLLTLDPMVRHPACILPCLLTVQWVLMVHLTDLLMDPWVLTVLHLSWTEWIQVDSGLRVVRYPCLNPIIEFTR